MSARRWRRWVGCLAIALVVVGCGDGGGGEVGPIDDEVEVTQLDEAVAAAERIVGSLLADLPVEPRERPGLDGPEYAVCDEARPQGPRTAAVTRGISFPSEDADDVLEAARTHLEARGVQGLRTLRGAGDAPQLIGVFGDQGWQVSVLLGRSAGRGDLLVNTPCLPGDPPADR